MVATPKSSVDRRSVEVILLTGVLLPTGYRVEADTPIKRSPLVANAAQFSQSDVAIPVTVNVNLVAPQARWLSSSLDRAKPQSFKPSGAVVLAGMAIAVGSVGLAKVLTRVPLHEGQFQIASQSANPDAVSGRATEIYQVIAPPTMSSSLRVEQQVEQLTSPALLDPAIAQLRAKGIDIDYASLKRNLQITPTEMPNVMEVRYQAADSEYVQVVLEQVAESYTHDEQVCETQACRDLKFIEAQLPQIQQRIVNLQASLDALRQRHHRSGLQAQRQQAIALTTQLNQQREQTQVKQRAAGDRLNALKTQFGQLQLPNAATLLAQDPRYQLLMDQLRAVELLIATELQQPQIRRSRLNPLYEQYQGLTAQLQEQVRQVANRYWLDQAIADSTIPPNGMIEFQQWIDTAHHIETLNLRQHTLTQLNQHLQQRTTQLTTLIEQDTRLDQQLQAAKALLEHYTTRYQDLQAQVVASSWTVIAPPETLPPQGQFSAIAPDWHYDLPVGIGLGTILGIGIAALTDWRNATKLPSRKRNRLRALRDRPLSVSP